jgi:RNA-directed DNA polymerase
MPDIVGSDHHKPTSLRGIADKAKADKQHRFQDLYQLLDAELLVYSFYTLNKNAASGVDRVTWKAYEENLHVHIEALVERLKSKTYRARLVRRWYIPKGKGKRPLGIPVIEDKMLQAAVAAILGAIYEQEFLTFSYAYRPEKGAKDAVRDLTFDLNMVATAMWLRLTSKASSIIWTMTGSSLCSSCVSMIGPSSASYGSG